MSEIRRAVYSILRKPAYALAALFTIALGIGANTAVYTVVRSVLLEPLPFREPKALVQVWETHPELHNLQVSVPTSVVRLWSSNCLHCEANRINDSIVFQRLASAANDTK